MSYINFSVQTFDAQHTLEHSIDWEKYKITLQRIINKMINIKQNVFKARLCQEETVFV